MKKAAMILASVLFSAGLSPQELQHTTGVTNIEVPVRVFDGDKFVDNLTLADFEVFENGKPQRIVGLYLVRKTNIVRQDAPAGPPPPAPPPAPRTGRHIVLLFELSEPLPKVNDALDYFFGQVLQAEDTLAVVTPVRTYNLKAGVVAQIPRTEMARQIKERLRKDILAGSMDLRSWKARIDDLLHSSFDGEVSGYMIKEFARQIRDRLSIDQDRLRAFAKALKDQEGPKHIFLFYQRDAIELPHLSDFDLVEFRRDILFDPREIARIFADASLMVNFIFMTQNASPGGESLDVRHIGPVGEDQEKIDLSSSFYQVFREMSLATGGLSDASGNPFASFQKAVTVSENYYVLYYAPSDYVPDGKFKEIKVTVKGKDYRITNRAGYIAS